MHLPKWQGLSRAQTGDASNACRNSLPHCNSEPVSTWPAGQICTCMYMNTYVSMSMSMSMYMYLRMCVHIYVHIYISYVYIHINYIYTYIHLYIVLYIQIYRARPELQPQDPGQARLKQLEEAAAAQFLSLQWGAPAKKRSSRNWCPIALS